MTGPVRLLARLRYGGELAQVRRAEVERAEVARVLAMAAHPARGQA